MTAPKKIKAKNWAETDIIQPDEIISVGWDFYEELGTSESVTAKTVSATDSSGTDVTTTIVKSSSIANGDGTNSAVHVVLQSLVNGEKYTVKIEATITADKILVAKIKV